MGLRVDPNARFEREKSRARQEENARQQQVQEAVKRKFASQGLSGAGSEIKTIRQAQDVGAERVDRRIGDIQGLQEQEALQRQQVEDARKFAKEERLGTQQFQSEQAQLARDLQQQQFAEQLGFSKEQFSEQKKQFTQQFQQSLKEFDFSKGLSEKQIALAQKASDLALEQFDFQKKTEAFNAVQSALNQYLKPGQTLKKGQVEALIGTLGPEIMTQFPNLDELFTNPEATPMTPQQEASLPAKPTTGLRSGYEWSWDANRGRWTQELKR